MAGAHPAESATDLNHGGWGIDCFGYLASWTRDRKQRQAIAETAGKVAEALIEGITPEQASAAA